MKILLVNDYMTASGGAELLVASLRDRLRERGHDARLFTSSAGASGSRLRADHHCFGTLSRFRTLLQTANPWAYRGLRRALHDFKPDVVHVTLFLTQLSPLILPLLRDVPALYYAVWHRATCPVGTRLLPTGAQCHEAAGLPCLKHRCLPLRDWLPVMLQMKLLRTWFSAFDLVVASSDALARTLSTDGLEVDAVIWSGVPAVPRRPPLTSGSPVAAFAGRLVREKGVDVLCRAFALALRRVPEARLLIAGEGPERPRIEALIRSLGIAPHVRVLGHVPRNELQRFFGDVWVHVVPSLSREGFGMSAAEAMIRGTTVIASDIGGLADFVPLGGGVLVPPGDVTALSDAMTDLLLNGAAAESRGREARAFALANLTEGPLVERVLELYSRLCSSPGRVHAG